MWKIKAFQHLTTEELFDILKERVTVFVVEQECPYPEIDDFDKESIHLFKQNQEGALLCYCRLIPDHDCIKLGRVLVVEEYRKKAYGKSLVEKALDYCQEHYPNRPVFAQAQAYLQNFYGSFGFEAISDVYLEDNIPHIDMIKKD